jgi:hypothetical protein
MRALLTLALVCTTLVACGSPTDTELPSRAPTIEGSIVAVGTRTTDASLTTIHVKTNASDNCGIVFNVQKSTVIVRRSSSDDYDAVRADALVVGKHVRVWTKVVAESCPGQAGADAIEITS